MKKPSHLEELLAIQIRAMRLPEPVREHRFHKERMWRLDFAWPEYKVAVEVQGGIWKKGGHSSGVGITRDLEKLDHAMRDGWLVYQCGSDLIRTGRAVDTIGIILSLRGYKK